MIKLFKQQGRICSICWFRFWLLLIKSIEKVMCLNQPYLASCCPNCLDATTIALFHFQVCSAALISLPISASIQADIYLHFDMRIAYLQYNSPLDFIPIAHLASRLNHQTCFSYTSYLVSIYYYTELITTLKNQSFSISFLNVLGKKIHYMVLFYTTASFSFTIKLTYLLEFSNFHVFYSYPLHIIYKLDAELTVLFLSYLLVH